MGGRDSEKTVDVFRILLCCCQPCYESPQNIVCIPQSVSCVAVVMIQF